MTDTATDGHVETSSRSRRPGQAELVLAFALLVLVTQRWSGIRLDDPALQTWSTMFVAVVIQSIPFLILGVAIAGAVSALVSQSALDRLLPRNPVLAVPVAGIAGAALPGCECASVPIAGSLVGRGIAPSAALTFLLAAPAINPIVLVSTAVAFSGRLDMVGARFAASLLTSIVVGWVWLARGRSDLLRLRRPLRHDHHGRFESLVDSVRHDLVHAGGFLILGGAIAASVNTFVPRQVMDAVADHAVLAVLAMAAFAFVVAMCSEADAFVAASMTAFSDTAKLVFMVVGPAVDVKLTALQVGQFGRPFALRFAPLTFCVAVACAVLMGWCLL